MSHKLSLVTTALLGTEQQLLPDLSGAGRLAEILKQLSNSSSQLGRERTLLQASAMVFLFEKSGRRLEKYSPEFCSPSQPEQKTLVSAVAAAHLRALLDSQQDLLPEWMQVASQLSKRVPDECLIAILQIGAKNESLRQVVASCVGSRGLWLSQFNPEWGFVNREGRETSADIEVLQKSFDFGSTDERLWALTEIRRIDAAKGLELIRSTWKTDRAEDRAKFLSALETGLSQDDEPFLESEALDDKRKEVRLQARECLLKLPKSRLSLRAEERAFACLSLEQNTGTASNLVLLNKNKPLIFVTVPESCDKAMQRDGIAAKTPDSRLGEKAWWLSQILDQVNPRSIMERLKLNEQQLLEAIGLSEWHLALRQGISDAVVRYCDRELAKHFLQSERVENADKLFALLDSADQEIVLSEALEKRGFLLIRPVQNHYDSNAVNLLMRMQHLWSPNFSKVILKTIRTHITQKNNYIFMDYIMRHVANHMDTEVWASVQDTWTSTVNQDATLERMMSVLSLRREMREALLKG